MSSPRLRGILRAYLLSIAFWYGLALLMGLQYFPLDRHHLWSSFGVLAVQAAAHAFAFTLWTPPIFYLVGKYLNSSSSRFRYLLLWALGAAPFVVLYSGTVLLLSPPYDDLLRQNMPRSLPSLIQIMRTSFADEMLVYIAIVVAAHAYQYLQRVRRQEAERYEYQQALVASELQALKMQLHPHFLFNTLHGISTLVDNDTRSAKAMILKLSNLLRTSIERESTDLIPLEEELAFAREYLELEKMRFGSRLDVKWAIAPETMHLPVPQMILQPLVENAIRHGITQRREGGWVEVSSTASDRELNLRVRNSTATTMPKSNGTGLGLKNVQARLKYLYSDDASLRLAFEDDRTVTVTLALPVLISPAGKLRRHHLEPVT